MNGMDLHRRIGWSRAGAKAAAKFTALWRKQSWGTPGTAEDCARLAKQPLRRLENLRRRSSLA